MPSSAPPWNFFLLQRSGKKFDVAHALSCKGGGFVTQRHSEVRNITGKLLEEVCKFVLMFGKNQLYFSWTASSLVEEQTWTTRHASTSAQQGSGHLANEYF